MKKNKEAFDNLTPTEKLQVLTMIGLSAGLIVGSSAFFVPLGLGSTVGTGVLTTGSFGTFGFANSLLGLSTISSNILGYGVLPAGTAVAKVAVGAFGSTLLGGGLLLGRSALNQLKSKISKRQK